MGCEIKLEELITTTRSRYLSYRSIFNLISTVIFEYGWESLTQEDKKELQEIINKGSHNYKLQEVREWYQRHRKAFMAQLSIDELKKIAKKQGIKGWSRLSKLEIMARLEVS